MGKVISYVLTFFMAVSLLAGCSSGEPSDQEFASVVPSVEVLDLSDIEEDLIVFLDWFGWYSLSGNTTFDSENINENSTIMNLAFTHCVNFDSYPGPAAQRFQKDPSGNLDYCDIFEESKTDWILENIFHYAQEDITALKSASMDEYYLNQGYYYIKTGGVGGGYISKPLYAQKDGDTIQLIFAQYQGDVMVSLNGLRYAVVSKETIDGSDYWTLHYWSADIPSDVLEDVSEIEGNWSVPDDASKSLVLDKEVNHRLPIYVTLEKGAGFSTEAVIQEDGKTAVFADPHSNYAGWLEFKEDSIILHVFTDLIETQSFEFKRGEKSAEEKPEDSFTITPEELEDWIAFIRSCYYTPGAGDTKVVLENGTDGWNYSREYYYHDGQFIFAFIYNGTEEHRLYFKDNHMIRYIDEYHTTYNFGNLDAFRDWEEKALKEALNHSSVEADAWIGTWKAEDGESIQITDVKGNEFIMTYNGYKADGSSMFHADHTLAFTDPSHRSAVETEASRSDMSWGYGASLQGNTLILSSRYPDKAFYLQ